MIFWIIFAAAIVIIIVVFLWIVVCVNAEFDEALKQAYYEQKGEHPKNEEELARFYREEFSKM